MRGGGARGGVETLASLLSWPLVRSSPEQPADAIVVLGARLRADGALTAALEERVRVGAALYRRGVAPLVVVTGGGPTGSEEAPAMAARARSRGVPPGRLRIEPRARNTAENARFVAALLAPGARVWLVTQPFHLRRAMYWFRKAGLIPLAWHIENSLQYRNPALALRWIGREYAAWLELVLRGC